MDQLQLILNAAGFRGSTNRFIGVEKLWYIKQPFYGSLQLWTQVTNESTNQISWAQSDNRCDSGQCLWHSSSQHLFLRWRSTQSFHKNPHNYLILKPCFSANVPAHWQTQVQQTERPKKTVIFLLKYKQLSHIKISLR